MRRVFTYGLLLCALFSLSACTVWKERPASSWKDATGGEGLERSYWNDVKARNWADLESHLSSNYLSSLPEGRLDRSASMERLKKLQLDEFSLGEMQTELNGNTFVVNYVLNLRGSINGQPLPDQPLRVMSVWQQQKSGWTAIAQSVTSITRP